MLGRMEDDTLAHWNALTPEAAAAAILSCCPSRAWAAGMSVQRPVGDATELLALSSQVWRALRPEEWTEAFASHPRIGERKAGRNTGARSLEWSAQEQRVAVSSSFADVAEALAAANVRYERRFGRVFLICASGRTAEEMLEQLETRMSNDPVTELQVAAEEQRKITDLRLGRWLREGVV